MRPVEYFCQFMFRGPRVASGIKHYRFLQAGFVITLVILFPQKRGKFVPGCVYSQIKMLSLYRFAKESLLDIIHI